MAQLIEIHPTHPQQRLLNKAANVIRSGGVVVFPTDSCYAIGCKLGDKDAVKRIRHIRKLDDKHHFTLACRDLSELSHYAWVENSVYRTLRAFTPGPYTFLLKATRNVPRLLQHPKRKTIGLRVPDNRIALDLLETIDQPLMSSTMQLPGMEMPLVEAGAIHDMLGGQVDLIIDGGFCGIEPTTVIDMTSGEVEVIREGKGDISVFAED